MIIYKHYAVLFFFPLLLACASSRDRDFYFMEQIENSIEMPIGSQNVEDYVRLYEIENDSEVNGLYISKFIFFPPVGTEMRKSDCISKFKDPDKCIEMIEIRDLARQNGRALISGREIKISDIMGLSDHGCNEIIFKYNLIEKKYTINPMCT